MEPSKADTIVTNKLKLFIKERVYSSGQGFIIHYVDCIWDSVGIHYREMRPRGVCYAGGVPP